MKKRLMLFLVFALCLFMPFTTQAKTKKVTKTLTVWVGKKKTVKIPKKKKQKIKCKVSNKKILTIKRKKNKVTIKAKKKGSAKLTVTSTVGKKKTVYVYKVKVKKNVPVKGLEVVDIPSGMEVGETATVKPIITPQNASNKQVSWKSSDTSILSVSSSGKLTAKKPGPVTITVTSKANAKLNVKFKVKVYPKAEYDFDMDDMDDMDGTEEEEDTVEVSSLSINGIRKNIETGESFQLNVSVFPSNATDKTVCFESTDTNVASVDSNGKVTGKKVGTTTIVIYPKSMPIMKKRYTLKVTDVMAKRIEIESDKNIIAPGERMKLSVKVLPENAANKSLDFSSENIRVATVTSSGEIAGVGEGETVIHISTQDGSEISAQFPVVVQKKSNPIILVQQILYSQPDSLTVGDSYDLDASVIPADSSSQQIVYSSSASDVISVSNNGILTAHKAGSATITLKAGNNISESFTITVKEKSSGTEGDDTQGKELAINPKAMHLLLGEEGKITIENYSNEGLHLKSSKLSVLSAKNVKINNGVLTFTPVSTGMVDLTITVDHKDGSKTFTCPITVTAPTENNTYLHLDANEKEVNLGDTFTISLINGNKYSGNTEYELEDEEMMEIVSQTSSQVTLRPLMSGVSTVYVKRGGFTLPCKVKTIREKDVELEIPYDITVPVKAGESHTYTIKNLTSVDTYTVSLETDYKVKNVSPEITEYTDEDKQAEIARLVDHKDGTFTLNALHQGTAEITVRCPNARMTQKVIVPIIK